MKKLSLFLLFMICCSVTYAQQAKINLKFIGAKENKVFVQLPVDGTTFYPARVEKLFDKDSSLVVDFNSGEIANVFISNGKRRFRFLIAPGISNITLDLNKNGNKAITYIGTNADGQLLLNAINTEFYQSRATRYYKLDSTAVGIEKLLEIDEKKELQPFEDLLAQHKISRAFYTEAITDIKFNYQAITAAVPIQLFFAAERPNSKVVFKQEFKDLWKKVYDDRPFDDLTNLNASEYYDFASYYSKFYVGMYLPKQNGTWKEPNWEDKEQIFRDYYKGFENNFKGKIREYLMASFLFNEMLQKEYQPVLVELFNDFRQQYSKSKFNASLQPLANEIVKFNEDVKQTFKPDQKLLANYDKVNSFADLVAQFKGKTVFVDIWATWCGPCKAEFEHKGELDKFLKSKGVDMLYISMDKDAVDEQWKDMIKYYELSGNHIRTNKALQQDLMNLLWDGKGYAIPRYLILKDGKIVEANAMLPSDKNKLYEQIAKYL